MVANDSPTYDRAWWWRKWLPERMGEPCRILGRSKLNSALIEFPDGTKVVASRYAVRRAGTRGECAKL